MVQSRLNNTINYKDTIQIDSEDIGHSSSQYEIELFDRSIIIIIGKPKYTFAKKNIVFYPVYVVDGDIIRGQIGIFEINSNNVLNILDDDDDIDLSKIGEPIYYNFISPPLISKLLTNIPIVKYNESKEEEEQEEEEVEMNDVFEVDDDEDDITKLKIPLGNKEIIQKKNTGVFTINANISIMKPLDEEYEKDAIEIKKKYKESHNNNWIQKIFKNENYEIIDNEGGGNCLFAVIRDAYSQIGYAITVEKLREMLANETTDHIYQQYISLYSGMVDSIRTNEKEMEEIKKTLTILAKRVKTTENKAQKEEIINEAKRKKILYDKLQGENIWSSQFIYDEKLDFMQNVKTFEDFKEVIKTSAFWGDTWAISKLEYLLNMKMIILSEESYNEGALDSVLKCGEVDSEIAHKNVFTPTFYIITCFTGMHYKLVSYKRKQLLTYIEIPYDVKIMITNKCMERNSGIFYMIQDFKNFKSKLGINPEEGKKDNDNDDYMERDLYDPSIVFMFHSKSEEKSKPGKGSNEEIPVDKLSDFVEFTKKEKNVTWKNNWRRKLDDSWMESPFTIDNLRWNSIIHYVEGSKFKKGFPDFYKMFSEDSNSDISKDVLLAKAAGSKTGKIKDKALRPKNISIDSDFNEARENEERKLAVYAKFEQNHDLKQLLSYTYPAKLIHFVRGSPAEPDNILMQIRKQLMATS